MSIPSVFSLKKNKELEKVLKKGKRVNSSFLYIKFLKNNLSHPRFGVIVSTKVSKKATERNLVTRRVKEALKTVAKDRDSSFDIVVVTIPDILKKSYQEIKREIEQTLSEMISQSRTK